MKRDQKGFTIVELLIAVAILSIVIASVCGFILVGSKSYAAGNSDINVQQESQLALNQMSDVMIDTTRSVNYVGYEDNAGGNPETALKDAEFTFTPEAKSLILFNGVVEKDPSGGADTLEAGNGNKHYHFYWSKEKETLFYTEQDVDSAVVESADIISNFPDVTAADPDVDPASSGWYVLARHVTDFSADLSQVEEKRVVLLALTFVDGVKEYVTSNNVTIRNKVGVNDAELAPLNRSVELDISVKPSIVMEPGETFTLPAPKVTGKNVTDKSVEWSIASVVNEDVTKIPDWDSATQITDAKNGILHVSSQAEGSFDVKVTTMAEDSNHNRASATLRVNIKRVKDITLWKSYDSNPNNGPNEISPGCTFTVSAKVTGDHLGEVCDCCGEDTSIDKHIFSTKCTVESPNDYIWRVWSPKMDGLENDEKFINWHPEKDVILDDQDEYSATFHVEQNVPDAGTHGYVIQAMSLLARYRPYGSPTYAGRRYDWVWRSISFNVVKGKTDIELGGNLNWGASTDLTASFEPMKFHYNLVFARVREYGTTGSDKIMVFLTEGKTTRVTPDMFGVETINKPWYLSLQALEPKVELPKGVGWNEVNAIDSYYKVDNPAVKAMIDDYLNHCDASGTYIGTEYEHTGKLETTIYPPEILYAYNGQTNLEGELKLQPVSILEGNPNNDIERVFSVDKVKNTRDMALGVGFANNNVKFSIYRETDGKVEKEALYGYNGATGNYEGQGKPYGEALNLEGITNAKNVIIKLDHNRKYNFSQVVGKYRLKPTIIYTQGAIADHYNGGGIYYANYSPEYEKEQYYEDERSTVYFEVVGGGNVDPFWSYVENQFTKGEIYFPTPSETDFTKYFDRENQDWQKANWWSDFTKIITLPKDKQGQTTVYRPSSIQCRYVKDKDAYELKLFYYYNDSSWNRNMEISAGVFQCAADGKRWQQEKVGPYDSQIERDQKIDPSTADVDFWMNDKHYKGKVYLPLPSERSFAEWLGFDKESSWEDKDGISLKYQPEGEEGVQSTDTMRLTCNYDASKDEYTIQIKGWNSAEGKWEYRAAFLCKSDGTRWRQW